MENNPKRNTYLLHVLSYYFFYLQKVLLLHLGLFSAII
jgi:hypothetical protein